MVRTPQERALETIIATAREVDGLTGSLEQVRRAADGNEPARWHEARRRLDHDLALAERAVEKARECASDATAEARTRLERSEQVFTDARTTAATMTTAPRGWAPCAREAEILAILREPIVGPAKAGHEHKERALLSELAVLDADECAQLAKRLHKQQPGDPIVAAVARMIPARRARLLAFLDDARRRASLAMARSKHATVAPRSAAPEHAAELVAPAASERHDALDARWQAQRGPVQGTEVARVQLDAAVVAHVPGIEIGVAAHVEARLVVAGDRLIIELGVGADHWIASATAEQVAEALVGAEAVKELGDAQMFLHRLPQIAKQTGHRLRIDLWGNAQDQSFAVLDLGRLVTGLGHGSYAGLRPVEAQILLGKAGGLRVFGDDQVKADAAIPGEPLGGWFELPPDDRLAATLGIEPGKAGAIVGGAFYEAGVLRVAIKPSAEARTGIVAHLDVGYVLEKMKPFGKQAVAWVESLAARIKAGAVDFVKMLAGKLHFELPEMPGTFFDFDLKLQLPRLFRGGHFDWASLVPSGFHLDLGSISLGALPRLHFPWLARPSFGGFRIPWDRIRGMLGSVSMPKLPDFELSLHLSGDLSLGLGVDLGKLVPDLGDLAIGFELHLEKLLAKIDQAGRWLLGKMKTTKDWVQRYVHLGGDGVLRFYDKHDPDGAMIGFHLLRLLDGADATDLAPTELRYAAGAAGSLELGEVHENGDDAKQPAGKASPRRPEGKTVLRRDGLAAPPRLAEVLALTPGAPVEVELIRNGEELTLWTQAKSTLYAHDQALRTSVNMHGIATALTRQLDELKRLHITAGDLAVALDEELSKDGPRVNFGKLAMPSKVGANGNAGKVSGFAEWKLEQLLGAHDWTAVVPANAHVDVEGLGGVQYGALTPQGDLLTRVDFASKRLRDGLFHDGGADLHAAIYKAPDALSLAIAKDPAMQEGALASVHPSALLHGLRKLGDLGTRALQWIADQLHFQAGGGTDLWSQIDQIAAQIFRYLKTVGDGVLQIELPGLKLAWNLALQLPHLGVDLDLGALVPDIDFKLPKLPGVSLSFHHGKGFPDLGFRLPHLGGLLAGLPHLKLPDGLDVRFHLDELRIGLSLYLGDLFGDGDRSLQFELPLEKLLAPLRSMGHWVGDKVHELEFKLGSDGVLRVFGRGKPQGTRAGFDLKKLFDGVAMEDLVPVELHADVDVKGHEVAEVSLGDDASPAKKGDAEPVGKVRVPRPKGHPAVSTAVTAPAWLRSPLGLADNAHVHASLYLDHDATKNDAVLFASAEGSDRGLEIRIHAGELGKLVGALGPVHADAGLSIDARATMAKGMLVVSFGKANSAELHGHAAWRLDSLLADPSLASLVPDEVVAERKEGTLELSNQIDLSGLTQRGAPIPLEGLDWAKHALGSDQAFVFAAHDLREAPRIALASAPHPDGTRSGVELTLDKDLVHGLEQRAHELADKTAAAAAAAFKRDKQDGHGSWKLRASERGLTVERGAESQPDHIYASYGWHHLAAIVGGNTASLLPDDMRVGTEAMALEMHALGTPPEPPKHAHAIGALPGILKSPLTAIGLDDNQLIEFHAERSRLDNADKREVRAVATVWNLANGEIADGRELTLTLDLEALLAHLLPNHRKWSTKDEVKKGGSSHIKTALDVSAQGLEMEAGLNYDTASGKHRELDLKVGWTLDQIIDLINNLHDDHDGGLELGTGQLVPDRIEGSFATDRFKVTFTKGAKGTDDDAAYSCPVASVFGLSALLGAVLAPKTLEQATLDVRFPSAGELKGQLEEALHLGHAYIPLVGCAIGVPVAGATGERTFYGITFAVAPSYFKKLLILIPGAGELLKALDMVLDVVTDPVGTAEALVNTPEALLDIAEAMPEVYGNIKKMGFKKLAMGLLLGSHPTVRQFVLASRIKKKLEAAGWKPGDPNPTDVGDIPNGYLEWVSKQDGEALVLGEQLDQLAKQSGIAIEPDYEHYGGEVLPGDVQAEISKIEHGFKDLEQTRDAEKLAPELLRPAFEQRTKEQAAKVSAHLEQVLASGVRPAQASADLETKPHTAERANVDDAAVNKIDQLKPTPDQTADAYALFAEEGKDETQKKAILDSVEAQEWVQTFAGLSQDQLGELLLTGTTIATTATGKVQVAIKGEIQKAFVRKLYVTRMQHANVPLSQQPGEMDDAKLVAAQQAHAARTEDAAEAEAEAALDEAAEAGRGEDGDRERDDAAESAAAGTGKGHDTGDAAGTGAGAGHSPGGAATAEKDGDAKAKPDAKDASEAHKQTLEDRFKIKAKDITAFVELDEEGGLELTAAGKALQGQSWELNGAKATVDQLPAIENVRTAGHGAHKVTFFTFRLHVGGKDGGDVEQQYVLHGSKVTEAEHADGRALLAGFAKALSHDGKSWHVSATPTFDAGPFTIMVRRATELDADTLSVEVRFQAIRTRDGYASVKTADSDEKLVNVGDVVTIRVPAPKAVSNH